MMYLRTNLFVLSSSLNRGRRVLPPNRELLLSGRHKVLGHGTHASRNKRKSAKEGKTGNGYGKDRLSGREGGGARGGRTDAT